MAKVYIADKETLDNVKQDTNNIKENVNNVTNNVQYIKNQFPISGGTDWSKYENVEKKINFDNRDEAGTILEIKGKGYVRDLLIEISDESEMYIYIDGKTYDKSRPRGGSTAAIGIYTPCDIVYENFDGAKYHLAGGITYNSLCYDESTHIAQPIFFTNNIKVELKKGYIRNLYFLGGVEK